MRIDAPGALTTVELPAPEPGPGEAVVDVAYAGICGSDVEIFSGGRPPSLVSYPIVPGHEWSGTVAAVGSEVDAALVGRKVVGEGFRSCHTCRACRAGEPVLCDQPYDEVGFTRPGAWADQLALDAEQLHVLPEDADLRGAAGLEPAACAADMVLRADVHADDRVAVVGAGTIGALTVQLLRGATAHDVVIIDPNPRRGGLHPDVAARHRSRLDVVIEASGASAAPMMCLDLVRRGGRLVLAGIPDETSVLSVRDLVGRRVDVRTVFGAPHRAWDLAVAAFRAGTLDPGVLVTHELALDAATDALTMLASRHHDIGKVLLHP